MTTYGTRLSLSRFSVATQIYTLFFTTLSSVGPHTLLHDFPFQQSMQAAHRRHFRRKNDHNHNNGNNPPAVTSVVSQVLGGLQTITAVAAPTQTSGGGGTTNGANPPSSPLTTSMGSVPPGTDPAPAPPGGTSPGSSDPNSPNPQSPSGTLPPDVLGGSGSATDAASAAAASQDASGPNSVNQINGNAANDPNSTQGSRFPASPSSATGNGSSGDPNSPDSIDGSNNDPTSSGSAANARHHNLSPGAAFGISFLFLLFAIGITIVVLRRRNTVRRNQRRHNWFGANHLRGFGLSEDSENATIGSGTRSARSSFGTNIDRGLTPVASISEFRPISFPPMAEVRQSIAHAEVPTEMLVNTGADSNRSSISSTYSGTQSHLNMNLPGASNHDPSVPMLVSLFTPSESFAFAFPQPPSPTSAGKDKRFEEDARASSLWLSKPVTPQLVVEVPTRAVLAGGPSPSAPPSPARVSPTADPFADPLENNDDNLYNLYSEHSNAETVRRTFTPTLGDEMAVEPGDQVMIHNLFDDGWALVEKNGAKGLIPLVCLKETGQDTPAFMGAKRVSSFGRAM